MSHRHSQSTQSCIKSLQYDSSTTADADIPQRIPCSLLSRSPGIGRNSLPHVLINQSRPMLIPRLSSYRGDPQELVSKLANGIFNLIDEVEGLSSILETVIECSRQGKIVFEDKSENQSNFSQIYTNVVNESQSSDEGSCIQSMQTQTGTSDEMGIEGKHFSKKLALIRQEKKRLNGALLAHSEFAKIVEEKTRLRHEDGQTSFTDPLPPHSQALIAISVTKEQDLLSLSSVSKINFNPLQRSLENEKSTYSYQKRLPRHSFQQYSLSTSSAGLASNCITSLPTRYFS